MKNHDVQSIEIETSPSELFQYLSRPETLPQWTQAFKKAGDGRAVMATPAGEIDIELKVESVERTGTVDWIMGMPDGGRAAAYSRVTPLSKNKSVFTFVLMAPPVPLERLEGTLAQQSGVLREEMGKLKEIMEKRRK